MRINLTSVALWFFVCAVIEPDQVEHDHYELHQVLSSLVPCLKFLLLNTSDVILTIAQNAVLFDNHIVNS
jgi:hypothetical protein